MANVATLKNNSVPEISNLFEFIAKKSFDDFSMLSSMRALIKDEFYKQFDSFSVDEFNKYKSILSSFNFYDVDNYDVIEPSKMFDLMKNLSFFKDEVLSFIDMRYDETKKAYILERQVAPPSEAYERVGFSKLNIKYSNRDYGLLFE